MSKEKSMKKSFINSKFSFTKNFLYFLIIPALVLITGIVLISTIGFNLGTDFKNGVTFKVYANYEQVIEESGAESYDLNDEQDYNEMKDKIVSVLNENGLKVVSYRTITMDIADYNVYGGQAVEVVYQNNGAVADDVRQQMIAEFAYGAHDQGISSFDTMQSQYSFDYIIGLVAAIVFGLVAVILYLSFRFDRSAMFVSILQVAIDMFLVIGMLLVTRLTVNLTVIATLLATFVLSVVNLIYFYTGMKAGVKQGKFEKSKPSEMADTMTKELTCKKLVPLCSLLVVFILLAAFVGGALREAAIGIIIALVVTAYTSEFLLPSFWATIRLARKKKKNGYQIKDMSK